MGVWWLGGCVVWVGAVVGLVWWLGGCGGRVTGDVGLSPGDKVAPSRERFVDSVACLSYTLGVIKGVS